MAHQVSITVSHDKPDAVGTLAIYVSQDAEPQGIAQTVWESTGKDFARIAAATGFSGKPGQVMDIVAPGDKGLDRLIVLGRGKDGSTDLTAWTDRGGSLVAKLESLRCTKIAVVLEEPGIDASRVAELAAGMRLRNYRFDKYRTAKNEAEQPANGMEVTFHVGRLKGVEKAIADRDTVVEGTLLARNLVNEPANILGPSEFAGITNRLSDFGISVEVLSPADMAERGMGALLAVGQGSEREPRLVVMQWQGGRKGTPPIAFVGKGVIFDTGGISIKPAAAMQDMKGDMGGAAAVAGLMKTLALRGAAVNAVGVVGLVENMPDGKAYRPGDIVTAMSGKTIEVINTDAEGRLVLADALWYTRERFKPSTMIDVATLTGAVLVALAHDHAGLFSNSDELATQLLAAGQASGEKLWRLPLGAAYEKLIESRFADIKNTGGRLAGASTAAQFLQHFVGDTPWAHLDIAGAAFGGPNSETNTSWASGFGVAVLDRFVRDVCEK